MNIIHAGVLMIVYLFVIIALFMFLSSPFDEMMTSFGNINSTGSDTEVDASISTGRTVFNMIFAGLAIIPMLWFIVWVFHREPDWGYR